MGGLFARPSVPKPPRPPTRTTAEVQSAERDERRRRAAAVGRTRTILTEPGGALTGTISRKTLLGE